MNRDLAFAVLVAGLLANSAVTSQAEAWPGWRGPRGDGTCTEQNVPTR